MIEYSKIVDGVVYHDQPLQSGVDQVWPNHRSYIKKVLYGLGMSDWRVRFVRYKQATLKGAGGCAGGIKLIIIGLHSQVEMKTTLLHEILHHRNPGVPELEIEARAIKWMEALNG